MTGGMMTGDTMTGDMMTGVTYTFQQLLHRKKARERTPASHPHPHLPTENERPQGHPLSSARIDGNRSLRPRVFFRLGYAPLDVHVCTSLWLLLYISHLALDLGVGVVTNGRSGCLEVEGDIFDGRKSLLFRPASWHQTRAEQPRQQQWIITPGGGGRGAGGRRGAGIHRLPPLDL